MARLVDVTRRLPRVQGLDKMEFSLDEKEIILVGRGDRCDVKVPNNPIVPISREHVFVLNRNPDYFLGNVSLSRAVVFIKEEGDEKGRYEDLRNIFDDFHFKLAFINNRAKYGDRGDEMSAKRDYLFNEYLMKGNNTEGLIKEGFLHRLEEGHNVCVGGTMLAFRR